MGRKLDLLSTAERAGRWVLNLRGFRSRAVPTTAGLLHVYDARGPRELPTIVLLHGLGSAATAFGPLLTRLLPHAGRVMAPDLPGHGFSHAPTATLTPARLYSALCEVLAALVPEPMVLVGTSLGGALALRYALEHPARLAALALISPAGAQMTPSEWDDLRSIFAIDSADGARRLLERLYHRAPWYLSVLAPGLRNVMQRAAVRDVMGAATPDDLPTPDGLRQLSMPILLLWGQSERLLPASSLSYFRRHLPEHAVIEEPAGFGHSPHFDDPARLAARLLAFARSSAPAGLEAGSSR
ncbi:MAG TPA: alpha/beta hydrolase [Polyangia bacterium]|nr:alpha/beta hydrolase [Polyangia bacterium]